MVKEIVTIHVGQAGCQVGESTWELFCLEHDINEDGTRPPHLKEEGDGAFESFFNETGHGQFVPRTVFVDTDPTTRDEILVSRYKKLYHPENVLGYKQSCRNNFFEGRSMGRHYRIQEDVLDRVRKAVECCSNLQGFFMFNSIGGGTGSGLGVEILMELQAQFGQKLVFQPLIYPSRAYSSSIVEPYNCIFATHYSRDLVNLSLVMDNEAAYRMCTKNLNIPNPDFSHINRILAQVISACTTSLRFESELNATMLEIATNTIPLEHFRYPVLSLAPASHANKSTHENHTTSEIVASLFEEQNQLCDCGPHLKQNRYMAAVVLLRGLEHVAPRNDDPGLKSTQAPAVTPNRLMSTQRTLTSHSLGATQTNMQPIEANAALMALHGLANPRPGHRQVVRFLPWLGFGGFKVGVVGKPPIIPQGFMSPTPRQGALLGNTTAVRQVFTRQYIKYLKLFFHKAYFWQFLEANGAAEEFDEAREGVRSLIDEYEGLLAQCLESEPHMKLVGGTSALSGGG